MKRSEELLGLTVISIGDGKEIGLVSDLVINPAEGTVEYLIIDSGIRYIGIKVLPLKMVEGIGEYAVTVQDSSSIIDFAGEPEVSRLLELDVQVKGTKVLTKKGKLIGKVTEFFVDEDNDGKITGCELTPVNDSVAAGIIPAADVVTFGKDVLVVNEGVEDVLTDSPSGVAVCPEPAEQEAIRSQEPQMDDADDNKEPSEAAKLFEERQRQYLLGRKVSKCIEADNGEVIAEEGDPITEELLDKAKEAGKFTELSMNTKA